MVELHVNTLIYTDLCWRLVEAACVVVNSDWNVFVHLHFCFMIPHGSVTTPSPSFLFPTRQTRYNVIL